MRVWSANDRYPELTVPFQPCDRAYASTGWIHAATGLPSKCATPFPPGALPPESVLAGIPGTPGMCFVTRLDPSYAERSGSSVVNSPLFSRMLFGLDRAII